MDLINKILTLVEKKERERKIASGEILQETLDNKGRIIKENNTSSFFENMGMVPKEQGGVDELAKRADLAMEAAGKKPGIGRAITTGAETASLMGGMAGSLLASQALESINGQFERQRMNDAYKKTLAQKSYDPVQSFKRGGAAIDPPSYSESMMEDLESKYKGVYGDEFFDDYMDWREPYNDNAYNQDELGKKFYAKVFNYGIEKVYPLIDDVYGKEYGYGSSEKVKNLLRMTMANEVSYGQRKGEKPIEGREYTGGYISADAGGHFFEIIKNMEQHVGKTEEEAMKMSALARSYWYAGKLLEELGIDPSDKDRLTERMRKGDPIVSMAISASQVFRNMEDPSSGSDKYPQEVRDEIAKIDISKSQWKKMDPNDTKALASHWASGWNSWGNLRYRKMDPNHAISEAVLAYEGIERDGLFEVGVGTDLFTDLEMNEVNTDTGAPNEVPEVNDPTKIEQLKFEDMGATAKGNPVYDGVTAYDPNNPEAGRIDMPQEINNKPFTPFAGFAAPDAIQERVLMPDLNLDRVRTERAIAALGEDKKKKSFIDNTGKLISYRKGGKVYRGVVVGYKDGKPIIKKK